MKPFILSDCELDPTSYNEAKNDIDAKEWQKTMNQEMKSIYTDKVWDLIEVLEGLKPIGHKWVYKRKRWENRKVKTFNKARLVIKGYTQKEGIDCEETFSLMAMLKSIRTLLTIVAHLVFEI